MKFIILVIIFLVTMKVNALDNYKIYTNEGKRISISVLSNLIDNSDISFFGEYHDDKFLHEFEDVILKLTYLQNKKIAVSMEMFEKDTQNILNDYLKNKITEKSFIKNSRAWPNYRTDYRNIIEFCKTKNIPVIAANIPRRIAAYYAKNGNIKGISKKDKKYTVEKPLIIKDKYMENFFETMKMMTKGRMGNSKMAKATHSKLFRYYGAQCLKDDTMSDSIYKFKLDHKNTTVIHYNGDFHSRYYLGTAQKIKMTDPKLKILTISPVIVNTEKIEFDNNYKNDADILIFYKK